MVARQALRFGLLLTTLLTSFGVAAQLEEIKEPLFAEASKALRQANEVRASLLAPKSYSEAADLYRRADKTLKSGGNLESIQRDLEKAARLFAKSATSSAVADAAFGGTLRARADAENAEAATYAPEDWEAAEVRFAEATTDLERGRKRGAERDAEAALELYRQAELAAIKANYLNETKTLLEQAEDRRADRWAPKSYQQAREWVAEAETALTNDRYDTDRPRSLAQQAKHSAKHAIYVSRLADDIDDGDTTLEAILLDWEASITRLADQVDTPVHYDNGQEQAVASIQNAVVNLQSQLAQMSNGMAERDEQINALNTQLADVQKQLGSKSQAADELNRVLAQQEQNRQRFATVESLFTLEQANVLRKGNTVIVRMLDLTFDSGSAQLKDSHETSLKLLIRAIDEFPGSNVVIEGHTDSFGSDATNLDLSQRRADSVETFLGANGVDPSRLTALGYGESQPVANNESAEGRRRNRRIDAVIYPPQ